MRIVAVTNHPSRHLFPLFLRWKEMGHEVQVFVKNSVGRLGRAEDFRQSSLGISTLQSPLGGLRRGNAMSVREFLRCISASDALVVGGYADQTALISLLLRRRNRPPTVLLMERPDHRTVGVRRYVRNRIVKWAVARCDVVWPISSAGKEWYEQLGAEVSVVAPYPMPSVVGDDSTCRRIRQEDGFVISVIGSLIESKNPLAAASTFRRLKEMGVSFEATFYGEGPLRQKLAEAVQGLPVRLAGHVSEIEIFEALHGSDVLLHPSLYDGWGMVVAEAIMSCTAVVAGPETDSACEFARFGSSIRVVSPTPDNLAHEIIAIKERKSSPTWMDELRKTRELALDFAGRDVVATRTLSDLLRRVNQ